MDDGVCFLDLEFLKILEFLDLRRMAVSAVATAIFSAPASRISLRCSKRVGSSAILVSCCSTMAETLLMDVMLTRARAVAMRFNFMTNVFGVRGNVCSGSRVYKYQIELIEIYDSFLNSQ